MTYSDEELRADLERLSEALHYARCCRKDAGVSRDSVELESMREKAALARIAAHIEQAKAESAELRAELNQVKACELAILGNCRELQGKLTAATSALAASTRDPG